MVSSAGRTWNLDIIVPVRISHSCSVSACCLEEHEDAGFLGAGLGAEVVLR